MAGFVREKMSKKKLQEVVASQRNLILKKDQRIKDLELTIEALRGALTVEKFAVSIANSTVECLTSEIRRLEDEKAES